MMMLALSLCYAGFTALCLSMPRHRRALVGEAPTRSAAATVTATGYLLIALALWPCVLGWGGSVGIVLWFGLLSVAALLLVALLAWKSTLAPVIAVMAPPSSLAMMFLWSAGQA